MYSKNDYRYYLENRLMHSEDYLIHGRSHKYIKKIGNRYFYSQHELAAFLNKDKKDRKVTFENYSDPAAGKINYRIDFNKHDGWSDGIGVRYNPNDRNGKRSLMVYDTTKTKWDKKNDDYVYEHKTKGRVTKERAEDGVSYTIDLTNKKKEKKKKKAINTIKKGVSNGADQTVNPGTNRTGRNIGDGAKITKYVGQIGTYNAIDKILQKNYWNAQKKYGKRT